MRCEKCGRENREGAGFCSECGAILERPERRSSVMPPPVNVTITSPENRIPPEYTPISMWGYLGYEILFGLPIVGWIILIVYAFGINSNKNVKNFARSYFCLLIIGIIFLCISGGFAALISGLF